MPYIFGKLWHLAIIWAIRKAFQCILQGARFLLANQTRLFPTSDNESYHRCTLEDIIIQNTDFTWSTFYNVLLALFYIQIPTGTQRESALEVRKHVFASDFCYIWRWRCSVWIYFIFSTLYFVFCRSICFCWSCWVTGSGSSEAPLSTKSFCFDTPFLLPLFPRSVFKDLKQQQNQS